MTPQTIKRTQPRIPLTRERVMGAAIRLADQGGIESLSMRKLGQEIESPLSGADWKAAMRQQAISGRDVLYRHDGGVHDASGEWTVTVDELVGGEGDTRLTGPWVLRFNAP